MFYDYVFVSLNLPDFSIRTNKGFKGSKIDFEFLDSNNLLLTFNS